MQQKIYRPCVVGVIRLDQGKYLVGERSTNKGSFQFPQGGIDPGESAEEAMVRELREEIGTDQVELKKQSDEWICYEFPPDLKVPIAKSFCGQKQKWFLFETSNIDIAQLEHSDGEFCSTAWWTLERILDEVVDWKKSAYLKGLQSLGLTGDHL